MGPYIHMKKITSTVSYKVPDWNFCNMNKFDFDATMSKEVCRFCVKTKQGPQCVLYNKSLSVRGELISKTEACCKASAGYSSTINSEPDVPTIPPKDLMKQTIDLYTKTVNELIRQGYPRAIADTVAKKHVIGD